MDTDVSSLLFRPAFLTGKLRRTDGYPFHQIDKDRPFLRGERLKHERFPFVDQLFHLREDFLCLFRRIDAQDPAVVRIRGSRDEPGLLQLQKLARDVAFIDA